ncbi:MAG: Mut7-C RNAse domain-containing protein [Alphaproteobacteria bacterium]|nr:Mut7-C RNAse domain-containing protein [Alphaproteobacteria bacterium]
MTKATLDRRPTSQALSEPASLRLLMDRMLIRLGRWLRAAGHDTAFDAHRTTDRALLERAVLEDRRLITCDRKLAEFRKAPGRVVIVAGAGVAAAAADLSRELAVDWLFRPFSRCLLCNTPVEKADPASDWPGEAPANAPGPLTRCPSCGKLYWQGGHAERMRARLEAWHAGRFF